MPDRTAGRPQDDLHVLVPWLILALADAKDAQPAAAGRLKAAAMQLLPPLLDGLHARRLAGALHLAAPVQEPLKRGQGVEEARLQPLLNGLVGGPGLAGTRTSPPCRPAQDNSKPVSACCLHTVQARGVPRPGSRGRWSLASVHAPWSNPCLPTRCRADVVVARPSIGCFVQLTGF